MLRSLSAHLQGPLLLLPRLLLPLRLLLPRPLHGDLRTLLLQDQGALPEAAGRREGGRDDGRLAEDEEEGGSFVLCSSFKIVLQY